MMNRSKVTWLGDSNMMIVLGVSVFFVVLNLLTINWTLPWLDEAAYSDYSVNFVLDGEWRTTAWFDDGKGGVYSVYPPLYQFVLVPWLWLFGVSPLACRSLSIVLAFVCCLIIYRMMKKAGIVDSKIILVCFLLLFWGSNLFSWMYRNGRVDILNMLCTTCFFSCLYNYLLGTGKKWWLAFWSFLVFVSGIQAAPFIGGVLIMLFLFKKDSRAKIGNAFLMFVAGSLAGLCGLSLFFGMQGLLLSFYYRTFVIFSSSMKKIVLPLLPYISNYIDMDVAGISAELMTQSEAEPFMQKLLSAYLANKEYLVVLLFNVLVGGYLIHKGRMTAQCRMLGIITLLIPLVMGLAGRFISYYTWMCYIPAIMYMVYLTAQYRKKILLFVYVFMTVGLLSRGLPKVLYTADKNAYSNVEEFVRRQNFTSDDKIASSFVSYYQVRNITKHCYFIGVYPLSLVPEDTKYILKAVPDHGSQYMDMYIRQCEEKGKKVVLVDRLENPKMELYVIE